MTRYTDALLLLAQLRASRYRRSPMKHLCYPLDERSKIALEMSLRPKHLGNKCDTVKLKRKLKLKNYNF